MISHRWLRSVCLAVLLLGTGSTLVQLTPARSQTPPHRPARSTRQTEYLNFDDMVDLERVFVGLTDRVGPSVVAIRVARKLAAIYHHKTDAGQGIPINQALDRTIASAGSGIIIRPDGLILTNEHVISDADDITVLLDDGSEWPAQLLAADLRSDLAVISIDRDNLAPIQWGDLADVRRGQWAFAMGDPYGLAADGQIAVSVGHISALGRGLQKQLDPTNVRYYGNLIQTTASINPGNSGGPLLNLKGQVIGINTAIQSRNGTGQGVGFAIPICPRTRAVIEALSRGETFAYGYLGVRVRRPSHLERKNADFSGSGGAIVTAVTADSPAAQIGLEPGDIILELEKTKIKNADHLVRVIGMSRPGSVVRIRYNRKGLVRSIATEITQREVPSASEPSSHRPDQRANARTPQQSTA